MRRVSFPVAVLLLSLMGTSVAAQNTLKIAYVHSQAVLSQSPVATVAMEQFRRDMVPYENELKGMEERISQLMTQYNAQQLTLTPEARKLRQDELLSLRTNYDTRVQQIETEAASRQEALIKPIMEEMNAIIQKLRVEGSYTFIFDSSAGGLIAADDAFDLTPEVVRRLNVQPTGPGSGGR